jgi:hypothetical protein
MKSSKTWIYSSNFEVPTARNCLWGAQSLDSNVLAPSSFRVNSRAPWGYNSHKSHSSWNFPAQTRRQGERENKETLWTYPSLRTHSFCSLSAELRVMLGQSPFGHGTNEFSGCGEFPGAAGIGGTTWARVDSLLGLYSCVRLTCPVSFHC